MTNAALDAAVFLDRDGTITQDGVTYITTVDQVVLVPGAIASLQRLQNAGYKLFVVTNQSGVGRGLFTRETVETIHAHLDKLLAESGMRFDRYYVCPHQPEDNCNCRKPKPQFLFDAAREYHLDLSRSFMIGDRGADIQVGKNAGATSILVLTGVGRETLSRNEVKPDYVANDLAAAATWILGGHPHPLA